MLQDEIRFLFRVQHSIQKDCFSMLNSMVYTLSTITLQLIPSSNELTIWNWWSVLFK
jgi:hypothetical protein